MFKRAAQNPAAAAAQNSEAYKEAEAYIIQMSQPVAINGKVDETLFVENRIYAAQHRLGLFIDALHTIGQEPDSSISEYFLLTHSKPIFERIYRMLEDSPDYGKKISPIKNLAYKNWVDQIAKSENYLEVFKSLFEDEFVVDKFQDHLLAEIIPALMGIEEYKAAILLIGIFLKNEELKDQLRKKNRNWSGLNFGSDATCKLVQHYFTLLPDVSDILQLLNAPSEEILKKLNEKEIEIVKALFKLCYENTPVALFDTIISCLNYNKKLDDTRKIAIFDKCIDAILSFPEGEAVLRRMLVDSVLTKTQGICDVVDLSSHFEFARHILKRVQEIVPSENSKYSEKMISDKFLLQMLLAVQRGDVNTVKNMMSLLQGNQLLTNRFILTAKKSWVYDGSSINLIERMMAKFLLGNLSSEMKELFFEKFMPEFSAEIMNATFKDIIRKYNLSTEVQCTSELISFFNDVNTAWVKNQKCTLKFDWNMMFDTAAKRGSICLFILLVKQSKIYEPAALREWAIKNKGESRYDQEYHRSIHPGNVFEAMLKAHDGGSATIMLDAIGDYPLITEIRGIRYDDKIYGLFALSKDFLSGALNNEVMQNLLFDHIIKERPERFLINLIHAMQLTVMKEHQPIYLAGFFAKIEKRADAKEIFKSMFKFNLFDCLAEYNMLDLLSYMKTEERKHAPYAFAAWVFRNHEIYAEATNSKENSLPYSKYPASILERAILQNNESLVRGFVEVKEICDVFEHLKENKQYPIYYWGEGIHVDRILYESSEKKRSLQSICEHYVSGKMTPAMVGLFYEHVFQFSTLKCALMIYKVLSDKSQLVKHDVVKKMDEVFKKIGEQAEGAERLKDLLLNQRLFTESCWLGEMEHAYYFAKRAEEVAPGHVRVWLNNYKDLKFLLSKGNGAVRRTVHVLYNAIMEGHVELVKLLIKSSVDLTLVKDLGSERDESVGIHLLFDQMLDAYISEKLTPAMMQVVLEQIIPVHAEKTMRMVFAKTQAEFKGKTEDEMLAALICELEGLKSVCSTNEAFLQNPANDCREMFMRAIKNRQFKIAAFLVKNAPTQADEWINSATQLQDNNPAIYFHDAMIQNKDVQPILAIFGEMQGFWQGFYKHFNVEKYNATTQSKIIQMWISKEYSEINHELFFAAMVKSQPDEIFYLLLGYLLFNSDLPLNEKNETIDRFFNELSQYDKDDELKKKILLESQWLYCFPYWFTFYNSIDRLKILDHVLNMAIAVGGDAYLLFCKEKIPKTKHTGFMNTVATILACSVKHKQHHLAEFVFSTIVASNNLLVEVNRQIAVAQLFLLEPNEQHYGEYIARKMHFIFSTPDGLSMKVEALEQILFDILSWQENPIYFPEKYITRLLKTCALSKDVEHENRVIRTVNEVIKRLEQSGRNALYKAYIKERIIYAIGQVYGLGDMRYDCPEAVTDFLTRHQALDVIKELPVSKLFGGPTRKRGLPAPMYKATIESAQSCGLERGLGFEL